MAFRIKEEIERGTLRANQYLVDRLDPENRKNSKLQLGHLIQKYGPIVEAYPYWHPLVSADPDHRSPITYPERADYRGLDHTIYLRNGFITCPYGPNEEIEKSVNEMNSHPVVDLNIHYLDFPLYNEDTTPILITCDWERQLGEEGWIPKSLAIPLFLELEVQCWMDAEYAETWETMRPYLLGHPHGKSSSLFVNREGGEAIKKMWELLMKSGAYGPFKNWH